MLIILQAVLLSRNMFLTQFEVVKMLHRSEKKMENRLQTPSHTQARKNILPTVIKSKTLQTPLFCLIPPCQLSPTTQLKSITYHSINQWLSRQTPSVECNLQLRTTFLLLLHFLLHFLLLFLSTQPSPTAPQSMCSQQLRPHQLLVCRPAQSQTMGTL